MYRCTLAFFIFFVSCDHAPGLDSEPIADFMTRGPQLEVSGSESTLVNDDSAISREVGLGEPLAEEVAEEGREGALPQREETEDLASSREEEPQPREELDEAEQEPTLAPEEASDQGPRLYGEACDAPGPYPTGAWETSLPEQEGFDVAKLQEAADFAEDNYSQCLIVARHGKIVGEWYWGQTGPSTPVKSWSVAKSYASTVAGIALSRGEVESLNTPVHHHVPEWEVEGKDEVTLRHLLAMSSGLHFELIGDNVGIVLSKNMSKRAIETPLTNPPGALWEYNNHTVQMIEPFLREATGMAPDEYAQVHLFEPLGMDATWKRDKAGQPAMYMNVKASCRDHLRFGYLFLRRGCWDGVQRIDESFVDEATSPSTTMNRGYGYWWWLNGQMPTLNSVDFTPKEQILQPGVPPDAFCALGLGNQIVEVIPSLDMVIVRFGPAPQENLALWAMQDGAVMDGLLNDDVQHISSGTVKRVVAALND